MKAKIVNSKFTSLLVAASTFLPRRSIEPIYSCFLFRFGDGFIELTSTDRVVTFKGIIKTEVEGEGEFALGGEILRDYCSALPPDAELKLDVGKKLRLSTKSHKASFQLVASRNFPQLSDVGKVDGIEISSLSFKEALSKSVFAISRDPYMPALQGAFLEGKDGILKIIATDGYRLSIVKVPFLLGTTGMAIVPLGALENISKFIDDDFILRIEISETRTSFYLEDVELHAQNISAIYPAVEKKLPKEFTSHLRLSRSALMSRLKAALPFSTRADALGRGYTRFEISQKGIELKCTAPELGENVSTLECSLEGEEIENLLLRPSYLIDVLRRLDGDEVEIKLGGNLAAVVIEEEGLYHMMMPMVVRGEGSE